MNKTAVYNDVILLLIPQYSLYINTYMWDLEKWHDEPI